MSPYSALQRPLLIFASSVLLLQLANAAMLPLMAGVVTTRSAQFGSSVAFGLAAIAAMGLMIIWTIMPETQRHEAASSCGVNN